MERQSRTLPNKTVVTIKTEENPDTPSPMVEDEIEERDVESKEHDNNEATEMMDIAGPSSVDDRLKEIFQEKGPQTSKKRKSGLVHEIIISVSFK